MTNVSEPQVDSINIENLLAYTSDDLKDFPEELQNMLKQSWANEIIRRKDASSISKILENSGWKGGEANLEKCAGIAAERTLKKFNTTVFIDKKPRAENKKHFLLHSLFPIGNPGDLDSKGTQSRLMFQGQFALQESRTALKDGTEDRNQAIVGLLSHLYHKMLAIYQVKSRKEIGISEDIYFDILNKKPWRERIL